ncbi:MAG: hypothetical protein HYZ53_05240 [Planctomycetes bacterium]|nr:hypothetical protein [Planctomycetota bacterium]
MKRSPQALVACLLLVLALRALLETAPHVAAQDPGTPVAAAARFGAVNVFVDAGTQPLAAYQFELAAERGRVQIVGVEGGEHAAFHEAPYYDPRALQHGRILIAAFSTAAELPRGKTRVARVHLRIEGDARPELVVKLRVAATADGKEVTATAQVVEEERK